MGVGVKLDPPKTKWVAYLISQYAAQAKAWADLLIVDISIDGWVGWFAALPPSPHPAIRVCFTLCNILVAVAPSQHLALWCKLGAHGCCAAPIAI